MITIVSIEKLEDFVPLCPLFLEGFRAMNKRTKVFDVDETGYVQTLIGVLNTVPDGGILVAFDGIDPVGYAAAFDTTPDYSKEKHLLMYALYVRPQYSKTVGPQLFYEGEKMAKAQGYTKLLAYNARTSGGSFRLFEKVLGMRRTQILFTKPL